MLLPVGALTKAETRATARALGLQVVAEKTESQDICFVPDGDHAKVIARRLGADAPALAPGPFSWRTAARWASTTATRASRSASVAGCPAASREPMFVVAIRPADRAVVIGPREALLGHGVVAREVNWLGGCARGRARVQRAGAAPGSRGAGGDRPLRRR